MLGRKQSRGPAFLTMIRLHAPAVPPDRRPGVSGPLPAPARVSDPETTVLRESAFGRRPLREALGAIERAVGSMRVVPLLMVVGALWWGQAVIIPIVVSILASYALEPAVMRIERCGLPRAFGVPLLLFALVGGVGWTTYVLRGEAAAFAARLPEAAHKLAVAINHRESDTPGPVARMQEAANELEKAAATNRQPLKDAVASVRIEEPTFKWGDWLWQGSHGVANMAGQLFAVVCLLYYLLVAGDMYKRKLVRIVGSSMSEKKTTVQLLAEIDRQIAQFLWTRVVISAAIGVAIWVAFYFLGLENPGVWAVLSAFLFAIPIVGPLLVILGAGLAGFVQYGSLGMGVAAAGVTAIIAALEGNVLTPLLMSHVGEMNAVAVFVSLMFWGWIWGIWGLVLAVPITAAAKAVCERIESLQPFAEFLKA